MIYEVLTGFLRTPLSVLIFMVNYPTQHSIEMDCTELN